MVVIATRDVADRFRGFLASVMLEIGPGVYTGPQMSAGVRERVWSVLKGWFEELGGGSIVMTWDEAGLPCGQGVRCLGEPPKEFAEMDGLITVRRQVSKDEG
ncbi:MAG: type I-E CRISPR-associated endoribonuclease Cas2 [Dehalococcoidia bacterium]|nr:type I-E CRISPR-associated endoribonuclease Cas2 [Dehalococcoidia bacterium]